MIAIRGNQNIVWKLETLGCNCRRQFFHILVTNFLKSFFFVKRAVNTLLVLLEIRKDETHC